MKTVLLFLFLYCGALAAGQVQNPALVEFANGNRKFSASVYKELLKTSNTKNLIVSPWSVETILALTNEGAEGETSSQLVTALFLPNTKEKIRNAFQYILSKLKKSGKDLKLQGANKIYVDKRLDLNGGFKSIAASVYESGVEKVDFQNNTDAPSIINRWVESNTNNEIQNLINSSDITPDTRIILVNTLYFSARWMSPFKTSDTVKKKFYWKKGDAVLLDTMVKTYSFGYHENYELNAKFLELPYLGTQMNLIIVLPNEVEGLANLEKQVDQLLAPQPFGRRQKVKVELPKFTIETKTKFVPILKSLGVKQIFSRNADLSGLSSANNSVHVSDVIQKALISVTESGTGVAAAPEVASKADQLPFRPVIQFIANHPFMYYIRDNISGLILFFGRFSYINSPSTKEC